MSYTERFKGILMDTAKGFGIGLVIAVILSALMAKPGSYFGVGLVFLLIFGSALAIIIASKSGHQGAINSIAESIFRGIGTAFFGSIFGSPIIMLFGIMKMFIGVIIAIPVIIYVVVSYLINFVYLGIMSLLEKLHVIEGKEGLCSVLDKVFAIIPIVVVVVACISMLKNM